MKKLIFMCALLVCFVFSAGCKEDSVPAFTEDYNVHISIPSDKETTQPVFSESSSEAAAQPQVTQPATNEPTEAPTQAGPEAQEEYRNQYTDNGDPAVIYEVVGYGENAVYTGAYNRYVYSAGSLSTLEKWNKSATGDMLISTTDYTYDGRGNLIRTDERIPDAQGNLYTYCLTEYVNNTDGNIAMQSISYMNPDETVKQLTVYGYTYDSYGRQTLATVTEDSSFISSTETEYKMENNKVIEKTETATKYPGTPYEQKNVLTTVFDTHGNILSVSENDTGIHYTTSYEYDSENREVSSRTTLADGTVSEYTTTHYEDLGGGCIQITQRLFSADGALYDTRITCLDAHGNTYIPIL